jgi:CDP-diacylglycerol---serine O-phosphatidyltransferase
VIAPDTDPNADTDADTDSDDDPANGEGLPWVGPRASEDEPPVLMGKQSRGLTLRAVIPNAITAAALCSG